MNERQNRFRGCLVAGAAGDALGYPIEFQRCIRERQQTEYPGKGLISDDTQMTIFTAEGLLWWTKQKDSQPELTQEQAIRRAYMDWYYTQTKTPLADPITSLRDLPELNNFRAPGVTCLSAMSSKKDCTIQSPCNDSKGCGGIMRVAPCGLFAPDMAAACRLGSQAAALTHGHPLGYLSAGIFAAMIWLLVHQPELSPALVLEQAMTCLDDPCFAACSAQDRALFVRLAQLAQELSAQNLPDTKAIPQLGEGWVAEEAFAISVYAFLKYPDDIASVLVCAVNHDGDSDSTGAIAGNLAGARLGLSAIPARYTDTLELRDLLIDLADQLEQAAM